MKKWIIALAFYAGLFYVIANAAFALSSPQAWVRASWTARRGINQEYDPWSDGQIRALGLFFALVAVGWAWVIVKLTMSLLQ